MRDPRRRWANDYVILTAAALAALTALDGAHRTTVPLEVWSLPIAVMALGLGLRRLLVRPRESSWVGLGVPLGVFLAPSLLLAADDPRVTWRVVLVVLLATATAVVGFGRRLQAPLVAGALVLAAHALIQLGPDVARTLAGQPRWVSIGLAGGLFLLLGATYEHRLRELRAVRTAVTALR